MNSRGFEEQFHWIFVMIAGGVILGFFFMVAQKQRSLSQEHLQVTLATDVEDIFVGALVSKGAAQLLPLPSDGIGFECNRGCACFFSISRARKDFGEKSMFAPSILEGEDALLWTVDWKQPYRVSNFIFATNPDYRYVFVFDDSDGESRRLLEVVTKSLPPPLRRQGVVVASVVYVNVSLDDLSSLDAEEFVHNRFVFLNIPLERVRSVQLARSLRRVSSGVSVDKTAIGFYSYDGSFNQVDYVAYSGLPSVFAAIFSADNVMFKCSMETAFERLAVVSAVYERRSATLDEALAESKPWCSYGSIGQALGEQRKVAESVAADLKKAKDQIASLSRISSGLEKLNGELVQASCPELF
ncbi:hypothetical protein HY489_04145 [Candidatus Woesearchaeota archaeon]|nr:hypothetical protein [Candidatus Woesearchaeota archaeon]